MRGASHLMAMGRRVRAAALVALLVVLALPAPRAVGAEPFRIEDIRVEGLQRISAGTVFNYLTVKVGETLSDDQASEAIRALFRSGFFRDVRLERDGGILVVNVVERPFIATVKIQGTDEFPEKDLQKALADIGLAEGRVFNRSVLDRVEQELRSQYFSRGFYDIRIRTTVTPLERNRVDIVFDITEGNAASIRAVEIVGNHVFPDETLLEDFELGTKSWYAFWSSRDRYARQKLAGDLERLRSWYLDRGYMDFAVESTLVQLTPNREGITITIAVSEGARYTVRDVRLSGTMPLPEGELLALVSVRPGEIFSGRKVTESSKAVAERLANVGHAFANVSAIPEPNRDSASVALNFVVEPGKRVSVRQINFSGNVTTQDQVMRREMRQLEGSWFQSDKIQRSRVRLQRLGYFDDVNIETPAVPGSGDQVDVNVSVKERPTGSVTFGIGYSDADGLLVNSAINWTNLFGSGKEAAFSLNVSDPSTNLSFRYNNPYWTVDGISRGFHAFLGTTDSAAANTAAYRSKDMGAGMFFGLPLSEDHALRLGVDVTRFNLNVTTASSQTAQDFVAANGPDHTSLIGTLGWSRDTRNSILLPTDGHLQRLSAEIAVPPGSIQYWKTTYSESMYWPVFTDSAIRTMGQIGLGGGLGETDELPFFANYFAGGIGTVRGYSPRSLGPLDPAAPHDPIGGAKLLSGTLEFLFPPPGTKGGSSSMQMALFVDFGQVWGFDQKAEIGDLRTSAGLAFNWLSPMGPLVFSYGVPLNERAGDETEPFQFTIGAPMR